MRYLPHRPKSGYKWGAYRNGELRAVAKFAYNLGPYRRLGYHIHRITKADYRLSWARLRVIRED